MSFHPHPLPSSVSPSSPSPSSTPAFPPPNPLQDLISSSTLYVHHLSLVIKRVASAWSRSNFPPQKLDLMFRAIEQVYRIEKSLLAQLLEIGPYPTSPKALGDLLMHWIPDLTPAYTRYTQSLSVGFDSYAPVQSNPKLAIILAELAAEEQISTRLDNLFALPMIRINYYDKLYARLLSATKEGKNDWLLLGESVRNLQRLKDDAKVASGKRVDDEADRIQDLERKLMVDNVLDLFTLLPKKCKLQIAPPSLTFTRALLLSRPCSLSFIPSAPNLQSLHEPSCKLYLLSDLFLLSIPNQNSNLESLLFPPLAGKHLRAEKGEREDEIVIWVMRKERLVLGGCGAKGERETWLDKFDECRSFAAGVKGEPTRSNTLSSSTSDPTSPPPFSPMSASSSSSPSSLQPQSQLRPPNSTSPRPPPINTSVPASLSSSRDSPSLPPIPTSPSLGLGALSPASPLPLFAQKQGQSSPQQSQSQQQQYQPAPQQQQQYQPAPQQQQQYQLPPSQQPYPTRPQPSSTNQNYSISHSSSTSSTASAFPLSPPPRKQSIPNIAGDRSSGPPLPAPPLPTDDSRFRSPGPPEDARFRSSPTPGIEDPRYILPHSSSSRSTDNFGYRQQPRTSSGPPLPPPPLPATGEYYEDPRYRPPLDEDARNRQQPQLPQTNAEYYEDSRYRQDNGHNGGVDSRSTQIQNGEGGRDSWPDRRYPSPGPQAQYTTSPRPPSQFYSKPLHRGNSNRSNGSSARSSTYPEEFNNAPPPPLPTSRRTDPGGSVSRFPDNNLLNPLGSPAGSLNRSRSAEGLRENGYRMPSKKLEEERSNSAPGSTSGQADEDEEDSQEERRRVDSRVANGGEERAVIIASMKCKLFLQQHHAQWKSLGVTKLKVFLRDGGEKQIVVEGDSGKKSGIMISCLVRSDGVERVGKTGVAVEVGDEGAAGKGRVYMLQMKNEQAATGLFEQLLLGSDREFRLSRSQLRR